ncbi:hypothetical protein Bbelb_270310 [Branchiostoma belcheri]|nr:hypothetical protein Bbelb_270310 [Branchiostoma belcheri]
MKLVSDLGALKSAQDVVACQDSNPRPLGSESSTLPLRHTTPHIVAVERVTLIPDAWFDRIPISSTDGCRTDVPVEELRMCKPKTLDETSDPLHYVCPQNDRIRTHSSIYCPTRDDSSMAETLQTLTQ